MATQLEERVLGKHMKYIASCLTVIPQAYTALESSRVTLLYFSVSTLAMCKQLSRIDAGKVIDYIYHWHLQRIAPSSTGREGFMGGSYLAEPPSNSVGEVQRKVFYAHIANTYSALNTLVILGDPLERIDRQGILEAVAILQKEDGSFNASKDEGENDMRFAYCAVSIAYLLHGLGHINVPLLLAYVRSCLSYEGAFSQRPFEECHAGSTYCALALLHLLGEIEGEKFFSVLEKERLKAWLAQRQSTGFQGRVNKDPCTCYSFWVAASLAILDGVSLINMETARGYIHLAHSGYGGYARERQGYPDLLHTYMGITGLSLVGCEGLDEIHPSLNIPIGCLPAHFHLANYAR